MRWSSRSVDVKSIYDGCMAGDTKGLLSASAVGAAYEYPFSLYCAYHADPSMRDPPDPFLAALVEKGVEHEEQVLDSDYPEKEQVSFDTPEDGFMFALQSMADGIKALSNFPMFYVPARMHGYADVIERRDGKSAWGGHHYVVREIKSARNIRKWHLLQAAFYSMMLGKIQRRDPEYFLITNGDGITTQHGYGEYERLLQESIRLADRIRGGWVPPAVYGGGRAPWTRYCNEIAVKNGDVSLIPGVGGVKRGLLTEAGFSMVRDVASSSATQLQQIRGIGKKMSASFLDSAKAIESNDVISKGLAPDLPDRRTEIFLDLEGLNDMFDSTLSDYLIGALVRKDGRETYHSFIAEGRREDKMLESFLRFMGEQEDYAIYHWHHYERTHLRAMMERHGMEEPRLLEPDVMFDLFKIAMASFAFPTYSNSIKDIAKWTGFKWRHENVGATSSIGLYLAYADDPEHNREVMQMVLDYNEDDCIATRVIKDWLVSRRNGETGAGAEVD